MKILLKDNEIIVRIVKESDSDYNIHLNQGLGEVVDNDYEVSLGQLKVNGETPIDTTPEDFVRTHGSSRGLNKYEFKQRIQDEKIITESENEEIKTWWSELNDNDIILFNSDCPILNETIISAQQWYSLFGVTLPQRLYQEAPTTTTTTTTVVE